MIQLLLKAQWVPNEAEKLNIVHILLLISKERHKRHFTVNYIKKTYLGDLLFYGAISFYRYVSTRPY